jgi:integrase
VVIPMRSDLRPPPEGWRAGKRSHPLFDQVVYARVSPETRARERSVVARLVNYLGFRSGRSEPFLPAAKEDILSWVLETSGMVTFGTVQAWISHLKRALIDMDVDFSALDSAFFRGTMKGLQKIKGDTKPRQALPVTLPTLRLAVDTALRVQFPSELYQLTMAAALALGFGCLLPSGEFTYKTFDAARDLRRRDVDLDADPPTLRIRFSKMDKVGRGRVLPIPVVPASQREQTCPASLLRRLFIRFPGHPDAPLFTLDLRPGHYFFPATILISELRRLLALNGIRDQPDGRVFSGHSLRRGAATWAAEIGLSGNDIMHLGRWSPTVMRGGHQRYTEPTIQQRAELARRLMETPRSRQPRPLGFHIQDDDVDNMWTQPAL